MFKTYDLQIKTLLSENTPDTNWKKILKDHKEMIKTIQHERLIHLMVTIFVGTVMSMSFFFTLFTEKSTLLLLNLLLLGLFVGYLFHYRYLENTTQSWYKLRNQIKEKLG